MKLCIKKYLKMDKLMSCQRTKKKETFGRMNSFSLIDCDSIKEFIDWERVIQQTLTGLVIDCCI